MFVPKGDDVYTQSHNKLIDLSIRRIMGVVDSEYEKLSDRNLLASFVDNIVINIFLRWGVFGLSEKEYTNSLLRIYNNVHEKFEFDDDGNPIPKIREQGSGHDPS